MGLSCEEPHTDIDSGHNVRQSKPAQGTTGSVVLVRERARSAARGPVSQSWL